MLTYHSQNIDGNDYTSNNRHALASDVQAISSAGMRVIPLSDFVDWLIGKLPEAFARNSVVLTSDDAPIFDYEEVEYRDFGLQTPTRSILQHSKAHITLFAIASPRAREEIGRDALQRIIDLITTDATISIEERSNRIFFNVKGGNSAILIGKRGQTLEAIQYILEKIVNKKRQERIRIQVDVEGYLEKRRVSLEGLAARLAEKVKRTGKPATIGQMNSHDRRIVHIALKNDSQVRTQSMGEGVLRKLVIFPKKYSQRKKRP